MIILVIPQSQERLTPTADGMAELFSFAAKSSMGNKQDIGKRRHKFIAHPSAADGRAALWFGKRREQEQAILGERGFPVGRQTQTFNTTRRANNDWLRAAEQHIQAFLFQGGLKAADDCHSGITQGIGKLIGLQNDGAGALDGAE
jgi:hypothetical protein